VAVDQWTNDNTTTVVGCWLVFASFAFSAPDRCEELLEEGLMPLF
jgi:hypothetical protein